MKLIMKFNLCFLYILLANAFINCKERYIYENQERTNYLKSDIFSSYFRSNILSFSKNNDYFNDNSDIEPEIIYKSINPLEVQTELLFNEKIYIFNLTDYTESKKLLIHFYPLDCQIKISGEYNNEKLKIERIINYDNDAFYAIIEGNKIKLVEFKIKVLINSIDDYKNNRTYHLVINSLEYINDSNLNIKELEPTFLYFNNNFNNEIKKISLLYKFNGIRDYPISLSFFIKERVKFNITVSNGIKKFERTIAYIDRILIDTNFFPKNKGDIIEISIVKIEKEKNAVLIAKVIEDYTKPKYFQKNILNIEFIPTNVTYQYYFIEVFKGEEGEIVLNNKRYDGILKSLLIKKKEGEDTDECNILYNSKCYPKEDEINLFDYNEYSQTLYIYSDETENCEDGCYLLITYFSRYLNNTIQKIKGTEFSLLSRIVNQKDSSPQIVNIPLNEYIFGTLEELPINNHYYSVYIPDNTYNTKTILEIHEYNIEIYHKDGCIRYNINKMDKLNEVTENANIELELNYYQSQYISFSFNRDFYGENSQYYFRILQLNTTNPLYSLDTNKVNLCETTEIKGNYSCFFLIKNTYKDFYNDLIIYAYGNKKVKSYFAWPERKYNDYYSIDVSNLNRSKAINETETFLKIYNKSSIDYIIIEIQSDYLETLNILTNYYDEKAFFPSLQIYSYQLFYLYKETSNFNFDFYLKDQYRIIIRNSAGTGKIFFGNNKIKNLTISGKKILSFYIKKQMGSIYVKTEGHLAFNMKIDYEFKNGTLKELNFGYESRREGTFPMVFYLKDVEYKGADINFYFDFDYNYKKEYNSKNGDFIIIKGYIVDFEDIKFLNTIVEDDIISYMESRTSISGRYDERTNNGFIAFNEEDLGNNEFGKDIYYLIIIFCNTYPELSLETLALSKDDSQLSIPINKYISGSFYLNKRRKKSQKYYIQDIYDNDFGNNFIIEFSSNYKNMELIYNESIIKCMKNKENEGGFQKYSIYINYSSKKNENFFEVSINNKKNVIFDLEQANYILRYYYDYNNNTQILKYSFGFSHNFMPNKISKKKSYNLIIKNKNKNQNLNESYKFSYFLTIYDKKQIKKDELINTVAPISSNIIESNKSFWNQSQDNLIYHLDKLSLDEEYAVSFFVKIDKDDQKLYYNYYFDISTKKKTLLYLIIGLSFLIIILIIIFIFFYRRFKKKNKSLKEKVQAISFSSGINEDVIDKTKNKSKDDEDYETTFI